MSTHPNPVYALFIDLDGDGEPTLWRERRDAQPEALTRRCEVHPIVWERATLGIGVRNAWGRS